MPKIDSRMSEMRSAAARVSVCEVAALFMRALACERCSSWLRGLSFTLVALGRRRFTPR